MPKPKDSFCLDKVKIPGTDTPLSFPERSMTVNEAIGFLTQLRDNCKAGDMQLLYADGYDNAHSFACVSIEKDPGWEDAPKGKAVYFS